MGRGPHLAPITAMVRRRATAARDADRRPQPRRPERSGRATSRCRSTARCFQQWDAAPGFFLKIFDIPAGRLSGAGRRSRRSPVQSTPVRAAVSRPRSSNLICRTTRRRCGGYDEGWQEAEYSTALGVWRWTSDRAALRIAGPPRAVRITLTIESPLRYFDEPPHGARAGRRSRNWPASTHRRDGRLDV